MKKLLLSTAAVGLAFTAMPAHADVNLDLGGYFKGYGAFVDQDNGDQDGGTAGVQELGVNDFDFLRDTEVHATGETVLDSGLVVGAHVELSVDGADSSASIDESYAYFSGSWGRVNLGDEDGAGYLLQVAAPSADSNIDGIRQYIQPVNYTALLTDTDADGAIDSDDAGFGMIGNSMDYDMDPTGKSTKLTYLSPIMSGFQLGATYSPDTDNASDLGGVGSDDVAGNTGATYELAARYEGMVNNMGLALGAGYSNGDLEAAQAGADDRTVWNVGADVDMGPFGVGVAYVEDNAGADGAGINDEETLVVGVDYTTGPFKLGASWLDQENTFGEQNLDTERYSGGVTYTYGPGMTFRGSVGVIEHEGAALANGVDATYVTLGTQVNF